MQDGTQRLVSQELPFANGWSSLMLTVYLTTGYTPPYGSVRAQRLLQVLDVSHSQHA